MLPHIIQSQIDDAKAHALGLREAAGMCSNEKAALKTRLLSAAQALEDVCKLATQLGEQAILNRDTIINRRAS
jgi:hypothetical protein